MSEKILRSIFTLQNDNSESRKDFKHRLQMAALNQLDYESITKKCGTILIREIGSYMLLKGNEITEEKFDEHFPIEDFAEIVICENDKRSEYKWVNYLKSRFPNKKILTINYFDLRSDNEVEKFFSKAKYITFSTTFSNYEWFKKLNRNLKDQKVIGFSHSNEKWKEALKIYPDVEIIKEI